MTDDDLPRPDLGQLDWSEQSLAQSLSTVFTHARDFATGAEQWYATHRRSKRRWARILRVGAILLGTAAAVLPVLSEIYTTNGKPSIPPGWAAVVLAAAAGLVALDHFFGFSSGWMRYMNAELEVTRLRHGFSYAWQEALTNLAFPPPPDEVKKFLALARDFVLKVDEVVSAETLAWTVDFQSGLAQAEHQLGSSRGH